MDHIVVTGARTHNLNNVDVAIRRRALVVITGLSGSGKSSLAFDTIYAEGQRRYVESLSTYARQFLQQMARPDVDTIDGLSPAIAIQQRPPVRNPRSTVGTITELYDFLRLLYARIGHVYCYRCQRRIVRHTVQEIVDHTLALPEGTRYSVVAPVIRGHRGLLKKPLERLRQDGYIRVAIDGDMVDLSAGVPALDKHRAHDVDVYVDRLVAKAGVGRRLTDSVELALRLADGRVDIVPKSAGERQRFSERFACIECGITYPDLEPRMFSFNSPHGACPACAGMGFIEIFDPELIVAEPDKSLAGGVIAPWGKRAAQQRILESVCQHFGIDMHAPWKSLDDRERAIILDGSGESIAFTIGKRSFEKPFDGVLKALERRLADADRKRAGSGSSDDVDDADSVYQGLRRFMSKTPCADCHGARLRVEARHIKVGSRAITELCALPLDEAAEVMAGLSLTATERAIAERVLREIGTRLGFLVSVGLSYLSLDRRAATLSGGETQRIRLATQIGSSLVGVLYVLDEPSIGLHPRDTRRLIDALLRLRDSGNTVLVVEHDEDIMRAADQIIDMGPGAGTRGGDLMCAGTVDDVAACAASITGKYLAGTRAIEVPSARRRSKHAITLEGASTHNLRDVTVKFPTAVFTCVTGVSGSGKSSLVIDTLLPALRRRLGVGAARSPDCEFTGLKGAHHIDRLIAIDQTPIGRTPRSNPATYTGVLALIRDLFAQLPDSKIRGYKAGRYSFNVKGGRCETCQGDGVLAIEMNFLPDVYVECEACAGRRYNRETLEIRYKGHNIAEVLAMTVTQASELWAHVPKIVQRLDAMREVGLGYLTLGQSASTLSGGEAQRLKLSRELAKKATGRTLYVLDEPTTGLHFEDIRKLLFVLSLLVDQGNSVVVIEHNLDVIKTADHVIDLGPEGGSGGGRVLGAGTPEHIAKIADSHTGRFLSRVLK